MGLFESESKRRIRERVEAARADYLWKEEIRSMHAAARDERREEKATEREQRRSMERALAERNRQIESKRKEYALAEKDAHKDTIIQRTGGSRDVKVLLVHHHQSPDMPVLVLPPHQPDVERALSYPQAKVDAQPRLANDPKFLEAAKLPHKLSKEVLAEYGGILAKLRDERWWFELCDSANLTIAKDGKPRPWKGNYAEGTQPVRIINAPSISGLRVAADGLRIRISPRIGDTAKAWRAKTDLIRAAFKSAGTDASNLTVTEDKVGGIVLRFNDRDPLEGVIPTTGTWDDDKLRSLLGIDADGHEVWITWKNSSGMVVGGLAGSGKTASMLPVFAGLEGNAELYIFDGKAQRDLHPLRHICRVYDNSGDYDAPLATLQALETLRVLRGDALYERLGAPNFWNLSSAKRAELGMKPIFVILDEAQVWFKPSTNKEKAQAQLAIREAAENLIRMGRSAGIVVIITTQRPSAESIPPDVRDNAQLKLSFKVTNAIMATMVLGVAPEGQLDPSAIPSRAKGRFVMDTEGAGMVLGQAGYIDPDDLEGRLKDSVPVADQWTVAERFAGGLRKGMERPNLPAPGAPAPTPTSAPSTPTSEVPTREQFAAMTPEERTSWMEAYARAQGFAGAPPAPTAEEPTVPTTTEPETVPPAVSTKPTTGPKRRVTRGAGGGAL
ncbi:hypothetical protein NJBCHELONAE_01920 [Mycobacteroides chelonae]|uniref:hypothetical protein n=1 Tax=Mycobacteroides chelonae TaxID=1774 RepID=UPI0021DDB0C6|nr:hypothetical protein [Mycobacteroides chelonae]GLE54881.1 hypothetical protein NJBCHELONAE_01920 [Mycobacteroides chelonae]